MRSSLPRFFQVERLKVLPTLEKLHIGCCNLPAELARLFLQLAFHSVEGPVAFGSTWATARSAGLRGSAAPGTAFEIEATGAGTLLVELVGCAVQVLCGVEQTKKEMQPLTPAQAKRLLVNVREARLRALYVLAITAGLREGELLGLRWDDVNLEREILQVRRQLTRTRDGLSFTAPKRGKARVVRLTDMAIAALETHWVAQNEERARAGSLWEETSLGSPRPSARPWTWGISPTVHSDRS